MTRPAIATCAVWLQRSLGAYVFAVDHPGLPRCAGAHRPGQPCDGQRGKHPCGRWSRDSTNDPGKITAALSRGPRNVGIDCRKSGFLVADEDRPGAFMEYAASIGQTVPETFAVDTAKGRHWYLLQPGGEALGNGTGALAGWDIDIRGAGGFVVGPGSVHQTGVLYVPVDSAAQVAPAPAWLISALRAAPAPAGSGPAVRRFAQSPVAGQPLKVLAALARTVLEARAPGPGTPGERNRTLYWAACRAWEHVDHGLFAPEAARGALLDAARQVGVADGAAVATIESARRMVGGGAS
jgi:Bifunctional DNA primase/polymerase, N-terminal